MKSNLLYCMHVHMHLAPKHGYWIVGSSLDWKHLCIPSAESQFSNRTKQMLVWVKKTLKKRQLMKIWMTEHNKTNEQMWWAEGDSAGCKHFQLEVYRRQPRVTGPVTADVTQRQTTYSHMPHHHVYRCALWHSAIILGTPSQLFHLHHIMPHCIHHIEYHWNIQLHYNNYTLK